MGNGITEHFVFIQHIKRKEDWENFPTLMEVLASCPDIFPNMNSLLRAIITLPLTSCITEKLFCIKPDPDVPEIIYVDGTPEQLNSFVL